MVCVCFVSPDCCCCLFLLSFSPFFFLFFCPYFYTNTTKKSEAEGLWHANLSMCCSISVLLQAKHQQSSEKKEVPGAKGQPCSFWYSTSHRLFPLSLLVLSPLWRHKTGRFDSWVSRSFLFSLLISSMNWKRFMGKEVYYAFILSC